ncbi:MAG: PTS sugar transporter subunit IIA [Chlamydiales bacterium]|nr:PTS sugar transporter subunit IIA [Chlamydiales bacterium]
MTISDYIEKDSIIFLHGGSRNEALEKLTNALFQTGKIADKTMFYESLLEREKIVSTGIGMGIAIPHAKQRLYSEFFLAIGIEQNKGIDWGSIDNLPVHLIFVIGGPSDRQNEYLTILSALTKLIRNKELRSNLIHAKTKEEICYLIKNQEISNSE